MGLRELIEGKQRRTAKVPILVGDPQQVMADLSRLRDSLGEHLQAAQGAPADPEQEERLRGEIRAALKRQADLVVMVQMQALPTDEWDAVVGDLEPDARGMYDLSPVLAPLLAASCTDPDLQDEKWWAEQVKQPTWAGGDKSAFVRALMELNTYVPAVPPGKG